MYSDYDDETTRMAAAKAEAESTWTSEEATSSSDGPIKLAETAVWFFSSRLGILYNRYQYAYFSSELPSGLAKSIDLYFKNSYYTGSSTSSILYEYSNDCQDFLTDNDSIYSKYSTSYNLSSADTQLPETVCIGDNTHSIPSWPSVSASNDGYDVTSKAWGISGTSYAIIQWDISGGFTYY